MSSISLTNDGGGRVQTTGWMDRRTSQSEHMSAPCGGKARLKTRTLGNTYWVDFEATWDLLAAEWNLSAGYTFFSGHISGGKGCRINEGGTSVGRWLEWQQTHSCQSVRSKWTICPKSPAFLTLLHLAWRRSSPMETDTKQTNFVAA